MTFELLLASRRNDQIGHLRRQEAPQTAHALDFAHLVGDAVFELLVEFFDLRCTFAQFVQQARVLDGGIVAGRKPSQDYCASTERYAANFSNSAFASFRSRVSKPSVNHP
jgi:hypothetical protein